MRRNKVYIEGAGSHSSYHSMWKSMGWDVTTKLEDCDLVQFTGGEDVNPFLYDEIPHPTVRFNERRDEECIGIYRFCVEYSIPMTGICRGGQFLNIMNGGSMFQHCDGHGVFGTHKARILESGLEVDVTSTHHQIMRPNREKGIVLMEADKLGTFKEYMKDEGWERAEWRIFNTPNEDDIEAIYYPDTNSLCYQPHPEYCNEDSDCLKAYKYFLRNHLLLEVE